MKFNVLLDVLIEPFSIIIPVGDYVVTKRVYRRCPILLPNRVILVNFYSMLDFDVILGIDCYMFVLLQSF